MPGAVVSPALGEVVIIALPHANLFLFSSAWHPLNVMKLTGSVEARWSGQQHLCVTGVVYDARTVSTGQGEPEMMR